MQPGRDFRTENRRAPALQGSSIDWPDGISVDPPTSRREQIVVALRQAIVTGTIKSGAQLKQDDISALFGASPGPVREALRQLASEGLVQHFTNRGVFVSEFPTDELLEVLLPVRLIAEQYAWKRAAQTGPTELSELLREQIEIMQAGAAENDLPKILEADVLYHQLVVQSTGSHHVMQLWSAAMTRIRLQLYRLSPRHTSLFSIVEEHRLLLKVFESAASEAIDKTLAEHIVDTTRRLLSASGEGLDEAN